MQHIGQHAVVIGASMGGLLAARVLADAYDRVTLIERDGFPAAGESRKGVPQGRHAHGLHARGRAVLEHLFPGFTAEMAAQGGLVLDASQDFRWYVNGGSHQPTNAGLVGLLISRPRLEAGVRLQVLALPNVQAIEHCEVAGIIASADRATITGVRLRRQGGDAEEQLAADLVVDAAGRGSRSPAWLAALGYQQPDEERVAIDLGYTTCHYRRTTGQLPTRGGLAIAGRVPEGRSGIVMAQEDDRWVVTLGGFNGDFAPLDPQGFVEFARRLPTPELYTFLKTAEPLSTPVPYRFVANQRRRYERLKRFPAGYLVFGDAICSFNPLYGQGMTVAANEALILRACLARGSNKLARRFFAGVSGALDDPWRITISTDLQMPHVVGPRSRLDQFVNWYLGKLHIAAQTDAVLSVAFLQVLNMLTVAPSLLRPRLALRVLRGNLAQARAARASGQAAATPPAES